jgi:hypothetical protein
VFKDTLTPPVWMNERTRGMFADKATWPHLYAANNRNVDPGFNANVLSIVGPLLSYCRFWRGDYSQQNTHFYSPPGGDLFNVPWPLPENLAYKNLVVRTGGHDGFPVGDLNWFPAAKALWQLSQGDKNSLSDQAEGSLGRSETVASEVPTQFELGQNYPNPFNPSTTIKYALPTPSMVRLSVFDMLGREVSVLVNERKDAGVYEVRFDGSSMSSGVYFSRLQAGNFVETRKLMLVK